MKPRRIAVRVMPNARRSEVVGWEAAPSDLPGFDRMLRVRLAAPPAEGKANDELVRFLARESGVARGDVRIVRGASSRLKVVEVPDGFAV